MLCSCFPHVIDIAVKSGLSLLTRAPKKKKSNKNERTGWESEDEEEEVSMADVCGEEFSADWLYNATLEANFSLLKTCFNLSCQWPALWRSPGHNHRCKWSWALWWRWWGSCYLTPITTVTPWCWYLMVFNITDGQASIGPVSCRILQILDFI